MNYLFAHIFLIFLLLQGCSSKQEVIKPHSIKEIKKTKDKLVKEKLKEELIAVKELIIKASKTSS